MLALSQGNKLMESTIASEQKNWDAPSSRIPKKLWCCVFGLPLRLNGWLNPDGVVNGSFYTGVWFPFWKTHVSWALSPVAWHQGGDRDKEEALFLSEAHPGLSRSFERRTIFSLTEQTQVVKGIPFNTKQLIIRRWAFWISRDPYMSKKLPDHFVDEAAKSFEKEGLL